MALPPNINFLISKQNKTPKIDSKDNEAGTYCYSISVLYTKKQSSTIKCKKQVNK